MYRLSHPMGVQEGLAQSWKVQTAGETGMPINTILYHSQISNITDDWASPDKLPKLVNLEAFSFINSPVSAVHVNEGGPGLPALGSSKRLPPPKLTNGIPKASFSAGGGPLTWLRNLALGSCAGPSFHLNFWSLLCPCSR